MGRFQWTTAAAGGHCLSQTPLHAVFAAGGRQLSDTAAAPCRRSLAQPEYATDRSIWKFEYNRHNLNTQLLYQIGNGRTPAMSLASLPQADIARLGHRCMLLSLQADTGVLTPLRHLAGGLGRCSITQLSDHIEIPGAINSYHWRVLIDAGVPCISL